MIKAITFVLMLATAVYAQTDEPEQEPLYENMHDKMHVFFTAKGVSKNTPEQLTAQVKNTLQTAGVNVVSVAPKSFEEHDSMKEYIDVELVGMTAAEPKPDKETRKTPEWKAKN